MGLGLGDRLLSIDGVEIFSMVDVEKELCKKQAGDMVEVQVKRLSLDGEGHGPIETLFVETGTSNPNFEQEKVHQLRRVLGMGVAGQPPRKHHINKKAGKIDEAVKNSKDKEGMELLKALPPSLLFSGTRAEPLIGIKYRVGL